MVADIKSERWPASNRNLWPDCVGMASHRRFSQRPPRPMVQQSTFDQREAVTDDPARHEAEVSRRELRMVLIGLMMALTLAALDQNIVASALPRITGDLGGFQHLSWVVTAFIVTSTVSAPLYGRLSDLYGRKTAFSVSISLFLVGSIACGLAGDLLQLIFSRAVQGLGAGG